ncbi:hypothetical protein [Cribrihabitans pelagius]|uniref:hypothetical protein n=1 Tax=Cribrihabitans pelagius TaxID=1765746 RepID=UPI003B5B7AC4
MAQADRIGRAACVALAVLALLLVAPAARAEISAFAGEYSGSAEVVKPGGETEPRDMSVVIRETKGGFTLRWTSVSIKKDGRRKAKTYEITFQPSDRGDVYAAAMTRNVFGHAVQLDPMKGEPYVWARIAGKTLTVFSLFVAENGDYEMQQYDRTLAPGGLELVYSSHRNGTPMRVLETFLKRK